MKKTKIYPWGIETDESDSVKNVIVHPWGVVVEKIYKNEDIELQTKKAKIEIEKRTTDYWVKTLLKQMKEHHD